MKTVVVHTESTALIFKTVENRMFIPRRILADSLHRIIHAFLSYIYLGYFVCLCVCVCVCVTICVGTLCYSFSSSSQTDQGDETEGLEREG